MTERNDRLLAWASVLGLLGLLGLTGLTGGCSSRGRARGADALDRQIRLVSGGLPADVSSLVALTNQSLSAPPDDVTLLRALAAAERAVALQPGYRTRWRAARAASCVGQWHSARVVRVAAVRRGVDHARAARAVAPERVGGYHFGAVNLGLLARLEPEGALSRVAETVRLGEKAREIDDTFQQGGPLRTLGATYTQAPPWPTSVGDVEEAEEILVELVERFPDYPLNHYFLGEAMMKLSRYDRAVEAYRAVLRFPARRIWRLEGPHYRAIARQRLVDICRLRALSGR